MIKKASNQKKSFYGIRLICITILIVLLCVSNSFGAKSSDSRGPVIKGLSIGMSLDSARKRLAELFDSPWKINDVDITEDGRLYILVARIPEDRPQLMFADKLKLWFDPTNKQVTRIAADEGTVNYLFNVADMDGKNFAQTFVNAYNIPSMDFIIDVPHGHWDYRDPQGVFVKIMTNKELFLWQIAKSTERSFD